MAPFLYSLKERTMLTREELIRIKEERGLTIEQIAKGSGVPVGTLNKILTGQTKQPRTATMQAIEKALCGDTLAGVGKARYYEIMREDLHGSFILKETGPAYGGVYKTDEARHGSFGEEVLSERIDPEDPSLAGHTWKAQGSYTVEDYYALPDDVRVELIDGVFYDMASPETIHQDLAQEIFVAFRSFVRSRKGKCRVYLAPLDVHPEGDNKTVLQPDILVVCDRDKIQRRIEGTPDLVVEILSPSTKRKDRVVKFPKYLQMGVREYWIVDPEAETVAVFDIEHDCEVAIYGFDSCIPVRIWNGECQVDMAEIYGEMKELYKG